MTLQINTLLILTTFKVFFNLLCDVLKWYVLNIHYTYTNIFVIFISTIHSNYHCLLFDIKKVNNCINKEFLIIYLKLMNYFKINIFIMGNSIKTLF